MFYNGEITSRSVRWEKVPSSIYWMLLSDKYNNTIFGYLLNEVLNSSRIRFIDNSKICKGKCYILKINCVVEWSKMMKMAEVMRKTIHFIQKKKIEIFWRFGWFSKTWLLEKYQPSFFVRTHNHLLLTIPIECWPIQIQSFILFAWVIRTISITIENNFLWKSKLKILKYEHILLRIEHKKADMQFKSTYCSIYIKFRIHLHEKWI